MEFTAQAIAQFLGGVVEGDEKAVVTTVAKIEEGFSGALSFLANPKYTNFIYSTKSSIVLVSNDFVAEHPIQATLVRVANPYEAFAQLLDLYAQARHPKAGVDKRAFIHKNAVVDKSASVGAFAYLAVGVKVAANVRIYPQVYVGRNVKLGENTVIYPGVVIYDDCVVGSNCTIHAGAVIGADGFGFAPQSDSNYKKIPQIGNVIIEDYVEIGANATVDRATMGSTILRHGVKIDDHVHVAHNVEIGENTVMAAQCGVAGSAKIGKSCMFGGQVGVPPHVKIADEAKFGAQSGVAGDVKQVGSVMMGSPAHNVSIERRARVAYKNLPELVRRVNELERMVKDLTNAIQQK